MNKEKAYEALRVRIITNSLSSNDVGVVHAGYMKYRTVLVTMYACGLRISEAGLSEISCVGHDDASGGDIAWHDGRSL